MIHSYVKKCMLIGITVLSSRLTYCVLVHDDMSEVRYHDHEKDGRTDKQKMEKQEGTNNTAAGIIMHHQVRLLTVDVELSHVNVLVKSNTMSYVEQEQHRTVKQY